MSSGENLDSLLNSWPYDANSLSVRECQGDDGRRLLQMRLDLGILQLETTGRPDGRTPNGFPSFLDFLKSEQAKHNVEFVLDESLCQEIDREFVQYYHRRICWLAMREFESAIKDADHTLALMDFCREYSRDEQWTASHEQYRPFVVFHRTQAAALSELERREPQNSVQVINQGLEKIREFYVDNEAEEEFDEDELVSRLVELRESLRKQFDIGKTLEEQLNEAIATEQYELAARLRDELAQRRSRR